MTRTVLCYGDSNTHGSPPMETLDSEGRFPIDVRWPGRMSLLLGEGYRVIDEGLPGRTTVFDDPVDGADRNGLAYVGAVCHSHAPVDLLILSLGANDFKLRFSVPAIDIALGLARLAETAAASGFVRDILLVATPRIEARGCLAEMFAGAEGRHAGLPRHLAGIAASRGWGFLDAGEHISVDPLDGVHYSAESHVALAGAMADAVRARFEGAGA